MSLSTFVVITNITNLSDARYCAGMGVDILGFNLNDRSDQHLDPNDFKEITDWIAGVDFAGEFGELDTPSLKIKLEEYNLQYLILTNANQLEELADSNVKLIYRTQIADKTGLVHLSGELEYLGEFLAYLIVDAYPKEFESDLLNLIDSYQGVSFIKCIEHSADRDLGSLATWKGIALEGSEEEEPGFKDYGKVMDVLEQLEQD